MSGFMTVAERDECCRQLGIPIPGAPVWRTPRLDCDRSPVRLPVDVTGEATSSPALPVTNPLETAA